MWLCNTGRRKWKYVGAFFVGVITLVTVKDSLLGDIPSKRNLLNVKGTSHARSDVISHKESKLKPAIKNRHVSGNLHIHIVGLSRTISLQNAHPKTPDNVSLKSCPVKVNFGSSAKNPIIRLRNDRFLFVIVKNGPNNQLSSLRDAIFLCIMLNRTLVLPLMFKHRSDRQIENGNVINIAHRVDLDALGRFIPFVTLDEFRQSCDGRINDVFRVKFLSPNRYRGYEELLNMTIDEFHDSTNRKDVYATPKFPLKQNLTKTQRFHVAATKEEVLKYYNSKNPCALYPQPYKNLLVHEVIPQEKAPQNLNIVNTSYAALYSEIIRHTRHPQHIKQMASQYIDDVIKTRQFLSVHWRFDRSDWMRRCLADEPWATSARLQLCEEIQSFRPQDVARAIANQTAQYGCGDVYIASPPTEAEFIQNVSNILRQNYRLQVFTHTDLEKYLDEYFSSCDWLSYNRDDIQSTIEMDIATISKIFLSSGMSSWSKEVVFSRKPSCLNHGILELVRDVLRSKDDLT
uniref:uncharacterized protein LOC108950428 n=1 Tax=Ciona intestinalis TaxID=7719 RepID=UPI00089DC33E|nr:uncharacterized protein LOC108950428 [Ciona intestinalis]|eukprot:XP_026694863.1 uncharacterized protein LOC108950428 [Ciona intestinalis]